MSRRAPRIRSLFRIARFVTVLVAVTTVVIGTVAPVTVATASAATSTNTALSRTSADAAQSGIVKTSLSGFNPGNIISDAVFFNESTMSAADIQTFFNSKVSSCQAGYVCLKDARQSTPNRPADQYCSGYSGAPNESAATIIYRAAQACGINPQVLIVMLQKEQGLVTHTWPSQWRYDMALGQGCPDTAPCDPAFSGFFYQIYGAARQMQIYAEGKWFQWYAPGNTWNILYHPNSACGRGPVYIENTATAALYYYTPYQPNAAALNAGFGEGDGCSSYGNRNFYNYFTEWFGSAKSSGAQVMRDSASGTTYLVAGSKKYAFPTAERAAQFTWISSVQTASPGQLAAFADGGVAPRAVKTDQWNVYLLDSGRRLKLPTCALAADYGWDCGSLPMVAQAQVNRYGDGGVLAPSVQALGSTWFVQSGARREILDTSLLSRYGISSAVSNVADALASEYGVGDPVLGAGVYADSSGKTVSVIDGGATYSVPSAAEVDAIRTATRRISAESLARLNVVGTLPLAAKIDGRSYILTNDGWMAVDEYGTAVTFTDMATRALEGMPQTSAAFGPHFVRERSGLQVYLVSGGALQAVSGEEQAWITAKFGVSPRVRVVADSVLTASSGPTKAMVRTAGGAAYLVDGANRYRFLDCGQVGDWGGDCASLPVVTNSQLSQTADRGRLNRLVRQSDGTTWLVQSGTRREVLDPSVLAPYGIGSSTTLLPNAMLDPFAVGVPVLSSGVYSAGGSEVALVNPAGSFSIGAENRVAVVTSSLRKLTKESFAVLAPQQALPSRMLSDGRAFVLTTKGWLQVDPAQYGGVQLFTSFPANGWTGLPLVTVESRPHFVREASTATTFLVSGGEVQPIKDAAAQAWIVARFGVRSTVWQLADGALKGLSLPVGMIFKDAGSRTSISDGRTYFQLASCDASADFGSNCGELVSVDPEQLGVVDGGALAALLRGTSGALWLVQDVKRREVPDPTLLAAYGIGSASTPVSDALLSKLPISDPVVGIGPYHNSVGDMRLVTDGGSVVDVPASLRVDALTAAAKLLSDSSFAALQPTSTLSARVQTGAGNFVLSQQGWVKVEPSNYSPLMFSSTTDTVVAAIVSAGTANGPRFVQEAGGSQVYLASGGLTPVSTEQQVAISRTYGVPSAVLVLAAGALQ